MQKTVRSLGSEAYKEEKEVLEVRGQVFTRRYTRPQHIRRGGKQMLVGALPSLTIILGGGAIMRELNGGGPWIDALYFSLMTGTSPSKGGCSAKVDVVCS